ncbi:MAG: adenylate/guanylate cyclase domain-containing protein [Flavobacteriales bacterium]|nr:adenylate/guanylate cyclase domain-containing protein [Flavobacteriales bacterium]
MRTVAFPLMWFMIMTVIYWVYEVPFLALLGIPVVLVMISLFYFVKHKKYFQAILINSLMHFVFLGAGIFMLGWESGLQFHLIAMSIAVQLSTRGRSRPKLILAICFALSFIAAAIYTRLNEPIILLDDSTLDFLLYLNTGAALVVFPLNFFIQIAESTEEELETSKAENEVLLDNILPSEVSKELRETGKVTPRRFEDVTILFSDFIGFTNIVATIPTKKLIEELNDIFIQFDEIMESEGIEKIQTVGDAYLAACGVPVETSDHAMRCTRAAKRIINYLDARNQSHAIKWRIRIGLHSGPITAGVTGTKKFTYDIFGDTINTASRLESNSEEGKINVSAYTYDLIKNEFPCEYRGKIDAKGKGALDMYFVL